MGYPDPNFSSGYPPNTLDPDAFKAQYNTPAYPVPSPFPDSNSYSQYPSTTNYTPSPSPYNQYSTTQSYSPQPNYTTSSQYSTNQYGTPPAAPYQQSPYPSSSQQYTTNQQYDYGANQQYSTNQQYGTNQQYPSTSQTSTQHYESNQQYATNQQYGTNQQYATTSQTGYGTSGPVSSSLSPYSTPTPTPSPSDPQHSQYSNTAAYSLPSTQGSFPSSPSPLSISLFPPHFPLPPPHSLSISLLPIRSYSPFPFHFLPHSISLSLPLPQSLTFPLAPPPPPPYSLFVPILHSISLLSFPPYTPYPLSPHTHHSSVPSVQLEKMQHLIPNRLPRSLLFLPFILLLNLQPNHPPFINNPLHPIPNMQHPSQHPKQLLNNRLEQWPHNMHQNHLLSR